MIERYAHTHTRDVVYYMKISIHIFVGQQSSCMRMNHDVLLR